ncbi:MAG TPA: hypothetical protein VEW04_09350, partial [Allosphingosinicella sp.]|nr:hypothetical protein [Allosphingosinicella sp.]
MTSPALAQDLPANPGYSTRLLQRAMAGYSDSTSLRSNVAANIAEALIRFRRCSEAMDFTPEGRVTDDFWLTRLFAASVATDQRPCRDHFAASLSLPFSTEAADVAGYAGE